MSPRLKKSCKSSLLCLFTFANSVMLPNDLTEIAHEPMVVGFCADPDTRTIKSMGLAHLTCNLLTSSFGSGADMKI